MFRKILVANRGEIACRVMRTCRRLGIATVAVYSDCDKEAVHTRMADEAIHIGPSPAAASYLRADAILTAAKQVGADAIHPGYGFLSENAEFAAACAHAGITFIGPKPESITAVGDKIAAKRLITAKAPWIPLIPGYNGDDQTLERLESEAIRVGFPLLLKASAGGGGKGMRIVREKERLAEEIELAKGEALRSFGSDALLVERYFDKSRHIEIQIIGDQQGNVRHCFERECSIQRRHQKIIEESPSPVMTEKLRASMTEAAVRIGELIAYQGVGTVEFIVDDRTREFFFLEVNTRLQVEHPVTECVTGLDLVELQIQVAAGVPLVDTPVASLKLQGCAMECRSGGIVHWSPSTLPFARYDSGVESGTQVTVYYDPMIAKITVWAENRSILLARMAQVLRDTLCFGITTNQAFLLAVLAHPDFQRADFTTQFVEMEQSRLLAIMRGTEQAAVQDACSLDQATAPAITAAHLWRWHQRQSQRKYLGHVPAGFRNVRWRPQRDVYSLAVTGGSTEGSTKWELVYDNISSAATGKALRCKLLRVEEEDAQKPSYRIVPEKRADLDILAELMHVQIQRELPDIKVASMRCSIDGAQRDFYIAEVYEPDNNRHHLWLQCPALGIVAARVTAHGRLESKSSGEEDPVTAYATQMPCRILRIVAQDGQTVKPGDTILTMESMKMETRLYARHQGVLHLLVKPDQLVDAGVMMCEIR
ncbi:carbamoyl-phosphate synthase L chain, ATP binding domain-containing protein [Thamnocephalis sphaerospora]|uniref:Carbamoyl-phosphate synthase L chain, ATP binding domain-containing protein n=1 Tax=Thamnocephalis sphaerospora TaxID=78915 RepID=A0A4P9XTF5_9FUNG|nr:carbamoyl-phosphate synthase L chain, ATP binding domain-containing protein [Thamnocephalis sphaerospora]|eukprot:RKP09455.1 carbamoyl-phosphate synthase L chain, ATP binding domain-containing protein [Thamnocephalis sphaerospora]